MTSIILSSELDKLAALESGEATADGFVRTTFLSQPVLKAFRPISGFPITDPLQVDPVLLSPTRVDCSAIVPGRVWNGVLVTDKNVDQLRLTAGCSPFNKAVESAGEDFDVAGCFQSTRCPQGSQPPPGDFAGTQVVTVPDGARLANSFAEANGGAPNGASGAGLAGCRVLGIDCVVIGLIAALFLLPMILDGRGGTLSLG